MLSLRASAARVTAKTGTVSTMPTLKYAPQAIVMPLFGANPISQAYHYLVGNTAALPAAVWTMIVVAGFGEEGQHRLKGASVLI